MPTLPCSLLALLALWVPRVRLSASLLLLAIAPYVFAAQIMLAGYNERGAYPLPSAWPTALVAMTLLAARTRFAAAVLVASGVISAVQVKLHDEPSQAREFAAGVRELAGGKQAFLLLGDQYDIGARLMHMPATPSLELLNVIQLDAATMQTGLQKLDADFARMLDKGWIVLLSANAQRAFERAAHTGQWLIAEDPLVLVPAPAATTLWAHLQTAYRSQPVNARGFSGVALSRR